MRRYFRPWPTVPSCLATLHRTGQAEAFGDRPMRRKLELLTQVSAELKRNDFIATGAESQLSRADHAAELSYCCPIRYQKRTFAQYGLRETNLEEVREHNCVSGSAATTISSVEPRNATNSASACGRQAAYAASQQRR